MMVINKLKGSWMALCALFALFAVTSSYGVEVKNLYKASVVVPDRSKSSLRHGSQEALAEVIIRVSGDSRAMESYDITQAITNPDRYMEQYAYHRAIRENPETGLPEPAYTLEVTFNSRSINQLIRRAGLPIWASNRAEVLVWLVIEDDSGRTIVNSDTAPDVVAALNKEAKRRGLPLAFPINDLQDQLAVSAGDIWGMFMDRLIAASERYSPGAILVGKVYSQGPDLKIGSWNYWMDGSQEWLETQGATLAEALAPAVDQAADRLAAKYAVVVGNGDSDFVWLNVEGVKTLKDFAQLTAYLDKLVAVRQANMDRLQEAQTRFRVYLESDVENLKQLLALDKKLIEIEREAPLPAVTLVAQEQESDTVKAVPNMTGPALTLNDIVEAQTPLELHYHWHRTYQSAEP